MSLLFKNFPGCRINAVDGIAGFAHDLLFDSLSWQIKFLVITDLGFSKKKVLISCANIASLDLDDEEINLSLEKQDVAIAPVAQQYLPVSQQPSGMIHGFYGWAPTRQRQAPGIGWIRYPSYLDSFPNLLQNNESFTSIPRGVRVADAHSCLDLCNCRVYVANHEESFAIFDVLLEENSWIVTHCVYIDTKRPAGQQLMAFPVQSITAIEANRQAIICYQELMPETFDVSHYLLQQRPRLNALISEGKDLGLS